MMANENLQNTSEIKLQNTSEIKLQSTSEIRLQNTGDIKNSADSGYDSFFDPTTRKERVVSIVICVIIAFIIWLIISNINMKASTPAPLPLDNGGNTVSVMHSEQVWEE